jgi:hypothetical protein
MRDGAAVYAAMKNHNPRIARRPRSSGGEVTDVPKVVDLAELLRRRSRAVSRTKAPPLEVELLAARC